MAIKENDERYGVISENPIAFSVFNYGSNSQSPFPPPPNSFMITEITEENMITESGDFMITEF